MQLACLHLDQMSEPWDELEYRELFRAFPLTGSAPSGDAAAALARRLGRSIGAIVAQWDDGLSYCRQRESYATSEALANYLAREGLCRDLTTS
jgi:hypothetical protein